MGIRSELFTTQVTLDNRTYFFNVKENRTGDIFLQIVESKPSDKTSEFSRMQIAVFADDMQNFLKGLDSSLQYIEKERKNRKKAKLEKRAEKAAKYGPSTDGKKVYKRKGEEKKDDGIKRTGRVIHVTSKRNSSETPDS